MTAFQFKLALKRLGWSAADMAAYLPTNVRTVNRYLAGSRKISKPVAHLIEIALELKATARGSEKPLPYITTS